MGQKLLKLGVEEIKEAFEKGCTCTLWRGYGHSAFFVRKQAGKENQTRLGHYDEHYTVNPRCPVHGDGKEEPFREDRFEFIAINLMGWHKVSVSYLHDIWVNDDNFAKANVQEWEPDIDPRAAFELVVAAKKKYDYLGGFTLTYVEQTDSWHARFDPYKTFNITFGGQEAFGKTPAEASFELVYLIVEEEVNAAKLALDVTPK